MVTHKTTKRHYQKYNAMITNLVKPIYQTSKEVNGWNLLNKKGYMKIFYKYIPAPKILALLYKEDSLLNNIPLKIFDKLFNELWRWRNTGPPTCAENTCMYKHFIIYGILKMKPEFTD